MAARAVSRLGIGGFALAVAALSSLGSVTPPTELPTVTVWHDPT